MAKTTLGSPAKKSILWVAVTQPSTCPTASVVTALQLVSVPSQSPDQPGAFVRSKTSCDAMSGSLYQLVPFPPLVPSSPGS